MPTVVIDGLSALQGGGQVYLRSLFEHFKGQDDVRPVAIVPAPYRDFLDCNSRVELVSPTFPSRSLAHRLLWSKTMLPRLLRAYRADVLFCPGGFLSTKNTGTCKTAVTFQNMLPFAPEECKRFPLGYTRARLRLLREIQAASFSRADLLIFISLYAKSIIDLALGKRRGDAVVIPHGLNDHFRAPAPASALVNRFGEYVLYVSILDSYKAQLEVIHAWHKVCWRRITPEKLLLVGPMDTQYANRVRALIGELRLDDRVVLLGSVPYADLPAIYQHAKANIFASSCENCPNILLEALAAGQPILCSDYQPMPEFAGDAVRYFDPYNPEQLADKLIAVLNDASLRADLGARAKARSDRFRWADTADKTWNALAALARGH